MKTFAALATAGLIAGAGALWFFSNPVVGSKDCRKPPQPSSAIPTFKPVADPRMPNEGRPSR